MSHTPEPWKWYWRTDDEGNADCGIYSEVREGLAYSVCRAPRYQTREKWETDSRRITACVNACAGLTTEALERELADERGFVRAFQRQRDELVAASLRHLNARNIAERGAAGVALRAAITNATK